MELVTQYHTVVSLYSEHLRIVRCSQFGGTAECVQTKVYCAYTLTLSLGHSQTLSRSCGEKVIFLYSCEIKSGSGLGTRLPIL